jgi:hypothetical protein
MLSVKILSFTAKYLGKNRLFDQEFLDGRSPRIYPWNQSKIENRKSSSPRIYPWDQSKIENRKSKID